MKKLLAILLMMVLGGSNEVGAQFVVPNSFTVFTKLTAASANANFSTLADALNLTGGTLTGNMTVTDGVTIDGADISTYLANGKLTASSSAADAVKVAGGITAAGVAIVDTTGKVPAISSTYFASLAAGNLTTLSAANLSGTIASATQDLITRTGTVVSGTWSAAFGAVSGANLTTLNASNFSTGTVATARLGTGSPDSTMLLRGDGQWASLSGSSIPSGMLIFSASGVCPTGFTEFTAARGRVIVGLPASGTSQGTVGTAFTTQENRAFTHTIPSVGVNGVTGTTNVAGAHGHTFTTGGDSGVALVNFCCGGGNGLSEAPHSHSGSTDINGDHSHTFTTSGGATGANTSGSAFTSDVMAYIQLPLCQKT